MEYLETKIPTTSAEFKNGNCVVVKTNPAFSSLLIGQAHEQTNKIVKGGRGAIGLTESSTQSLRWIVSGPEMSKINKDFELTQELVRNITRRTSKLNLTTSQTKLETGLC